MAGTGLAPRASGLQNDIEAAMTTYASLVADPSADANTMEAHIETLLEELSGLVDAMREEEGRTSGPSASSTMSLLLVSRHREILSDLTSEFRRIRSAIHDNRRRTELLRDVRAGCRAGATSVGAGDGDGALRERGHLMGERGQLHSAIHIADEVIGRAKATQDDLAHQSDLLAQGRHALRRVRSRLPSIAALVTSIQTVQRRDQVVVGAVGGLLFILFLWLALGRGGGR